MHYPLERFTTALGRDCREWPEGATNAEILTLAEEYSRPGTVVVLCVVFTELISEKRCVLSPDRLIVQDRIKWLWLRAVVYLLRLPQACVWSYCVA